MAEKVWEEKRQTPCHYDGREFDQILHEAEANMLRGIPTMEVAVEGGPTAVPPSATEGQEEKSKPSASPAQGQRSFFIYFGLAVTLINLVDLKNNN